MTVSIHELAPRMPTAHTASHLLGRAHWQLRCSIPSGHVVEPRSVLIESPMDLGVAMDARAIMSGRRTSP